MTDEKRDGLTFTTHLAEQFLNWYPANTAIYFRGERGKDGTLESQNRQFDQLLPFFAPIHAMIAAKDAEIARLQPLAEIGRLAVAWWEMTRNSDGSARKAENADALALHEACKARVLAAQRETEVKP